MARQKKDRRSKHRPSGRGAAPEKRAPAKPPRRARVESRPLVVGMVASAGGLDAFKRFFQAMPQNSGMAFVLIPHLDPRRESLMAPLLAKYTAMPLAEATEGARLEPNRVHVIPPNRYLAVREGKLRLTGPVERTGAPSIDAFLRSLAGDQQERAVCVILSGTGSHGALGLKAIKAAGGMAMVQEPKSAEYAPMPQSAVNTGLADYVLPVEKMPEALLKYARHLRVDEAPEPAPAPDTLGGVVALLRARTRFDFRFYRKRMLMRRVQRRMGLQHVSGLDDYLTMLRQRPDELKLLAKDLLISVTSFFRDPEAFETLKTQVIPQILESKAAEEPVRVWVPGCATGEEAYSLAMLFIEQINASQKGCPLQVFATDVDADALEVARRGVYPEGVMADLGPERTARFFAKVDEQSYQVNKQLRDAVLFAPQNLLNDAPFSRLDLISCRNVLIYLEPQFQEKIVALLHFALNLQGFLVLGPSETIGKHTELFRPVSKKWRIYRRAGAGRRKRADFPITNGAGAAAPRRLGEHARPAHGADSLEQFAQKVLLDEYAPAAVLTNRDYDALFYWGPTERYLRQRSGAPTRDVTLLAREGMGARIRAAVHKALRQNERVVLTGASFRQGGRTVPVRVIARPVRMGRGGAEPLVLLAFEEEAVPARGRREPQRRAEESLVHQLEHELKISREELQSTIEELESSNEELKASNEEVMSMNEELQSANEELETSKEELQSVNEELATVNSQLQEKVEELETTNNDMANLLNSADVATVFLRPEGLIARFTPAATRLFNLIATDVGRPIGDITRRFRDEALEADIEAVLRDLSTREKEVPAENDLWYIRRVSPYRTHDNRIIGVVLAFSDVTMIKRAERDLRSAAGDLELRVAQRTEALRNEIAERDRVEARARRQHEELLRLYRVHTAGALAASVAHELNQPLAAIASYCEASLQALRGGREPPEKLQRNLEQTLVQTQRAAGVIRELRGFLARGEGEAEATDINAVARGAQQLLEVDADAARVKLELILAEDLPPVRAAHIPIEHVLVNLVKNAIEAIKDGEVANGAVRVLTRVDLEGAIEVSVLDNGPGFSAEAAQRAFDAFYTTKAHGLGMGLSICRSIVESCGGRIWLEPPGAGKGASFHFRLPAGKAKGETP